MPIKFICNACGKEENGVFLGDNSNPPEWMQPWGWLVKDGKTVACSLECRDKINDLVDRVNPAT